LANPTIFSCSSSAFAGLSMDILCLGKSLRFRAQGYSMRPLLRSGDILTVEPANRCRISLGDVILCSIQPERIVVHRVVGRLANGGRLRYLVQGDQVARPDGIIPPEQVYGRVSTIERRGTVMDMHSPAMKLLGWLAVLRSRGKLSRNRWFRYPVRLGRRLPVFYRYLA
jgi:signal peptidase I